MHLETVREPTGSGWCCCGCTAPLTASLTAPLTAPLTGPLTRSRTGGGPINAASGGASSSVTGGAGGTHPDGTSSFGTVSALMLDPFALTLERTSASRARGRTHWRAGDRLEVSGILGKRGPGGGVPRAESVVSTELLATRPASGPSGDAEKMPLALFDSTDAKLAAAFVGSASSSKATANRTCGDNLADQRR
eukprot:1092193-Prorocentrum_minimum.AAC.6